MRSAHPGTAVAWEERIFEVRAAEPRPDGGMRYRLAPWEEGQAIRRFERYDAEAERGRETGRRDLASGIRKRRWSIALAPLAGPSAGLGPEGDGARVRRARARHDDQLRAATPSPSASSGCSATCSAVAGGSVDWPVWLAPPFAVALYLFGESALRLASAIAGASPWGRSRSSSPTRPGRRRAARVPAEKLEAGSDAAEADRAQALNDRYQFLEPLLSLLPAARQRELEAGFGFDAIRWGRITAWVLLVVGALRL